MCGLNRSSVCSYTLSAELIHMAVFDLLKEICIMVCSFLFESVEAVAFKAMFWSK